MARIQLNRSVRVGQGIVQTTLREIHATPIVVSGSIMRIYLNGRVVVGNSAVHIARGFSDTSAVVISSGDIWIEGDGDTVVFESTFQIALGEPGIAPTYICRRRPARRGLRLSL